MTPVKIMAMIVSIVLFALGLWLIVYSIPKSYGKKESLTDADKGHPRLLKLGNLILTIGIAVFVIFIVLSYG